MLKNSFELRDLVILDLESQIAINGGTSSPSVDTGFWYDVTYYTIKGLELVCDGLWAVKG